MNAVSASTTRPFRADAHVTLAEPEATIERVCAHFAEHDASITPIEGGFSALFPLGLGSMQRTGNGLSMRAEAQDESALSYLKAMLASHLIEYAQGERPEIAWVGDGAGATAFPNFREMTVLRAAQVTPHMRRITLAGRDLSSFAKGGLHLKLFILPEGVAEPAWPVPGKDGLPIWPSDDRRPVVRTYTIRGIDPEAGTLDIDFVVHGDHNIGSRWALHARPGDKVGIRGPVGRVVPQADWYLLVGDETALPAIARVLELLPTEVKGIALIEVADSSEEQPIVFSAGIELRWLHRNGAAAGTTSLLPDAVRSIEMPAGTRIYAMAGTEFAAFKAIRRYWRDELELNKKSILPLAYWRRGAAEGEYDRVSEK